MFFFKILILMWVIFDNICLYVCFWNYNYVLWLDVLILLEYKFFYNYYLWKDFFDFSFLKCKFEYLSLLLGLFSFCLIREGELGKLGVFEDWYSWKEFRLRIIIWFLWECGYVFVFYFFIVWVSWDNSKFRFKLFF